MKDIDLAIKKQLEAVASIPVDSPHLSRFLNGLGKSYFERYIHSRDVKDIDLAIKQYVKLETVASLSPFNRPTFINNLGSSYLCRFQSFREVRDIDFAIEKLVEAVAAIPLDSPNRLISLNNLWLSYWSRFGSNQELTDMEESISNFRLSSSLSGDYQSRVSLGHFNGPILLICSVIWSQLLKHMIRLCVFYLKWLGSGLMP